MGEVLSRDDLLAARRRGARGGPHDRVRQRLSSTCCTSATCAISRRAAQEADVLVVAINDDASVRALKGEGRPILRRATAPSSWPRCAAWTTS